MKRLRHFPLLMSLMVLCASLDSLAQQTAGNDVSKYRPGEDIVSEAVPKVGGLGALHSRSVDIRSGPPKLVPAGMLEPAPVELRRALGEEHALRQTEALSLMPRAGTPDNAPPSAIAGATAAAATASMNPRMQDMDTLRERLRQAGAGTLDAATSQAVKEAGTARLRADREAFRPTLATAAGQASRSVSTTVPELARKTPLLPLPATKAAPTASCRQPDIERLTQALAEADNPDEMDRLHLRLAAGYVGGGEWAEARAIYEDLAQNAHRKAIRYTAQINLEILSGTRPPAKATREIPIPGVPVGADEGRVEK